MATIKEQANRFFNRSTGGSAFMVCDPYGIHKPLPQYGLKLVTDDDYGEFHKFMADVAKEAMKKNFVADATIFFYYFRDTRNLPRMPAMQMHHYGTKTLIPWCEQHGHLPAHEIKLRDTVFAIQNGIDTKQLTRKELDFRNTQQYREFIDTQNERERLYRFSEDVKVPITVIQTNKGVLLFSYDEVGLSALRNFYQHVADNYFKPDFDIKSSQDFSLESFSHDLIDSSICGITSIYADSSASLFCLESARAYISVVCIDTCPRISLM